jgi:hypothetical protein
MTKQELIDIIYYSDGKLFWNISKQNVKKDTECGTIDTHGYKVVFINGKNYKTHRLIFLYFHGFMPKYIDHIDGDRLNNDISNLRACTHLQNNYNSKIRKDNTSGIKGVHWHKPTNKWTAQCRVAGKHKTLGYFDNIEDATKVLQEFRKVNHGVFSNNG